jgi:hypothetical protein
MNYVFKLFLDNLMVFYLDDVMVFSENMNDHKKHLEEGFEALR